jgi:hypothetical protein
MKMRLLLSTTLVMSVLVTAPMVAFGQSNHWDSTVPTRHPDDPAYRSREYWEQRRQDTLGGAVPLEERARLCDRELDRLHEFAAAARGHIWKRDISLYNNGYVQHGEVVQIDRNMQDHEIDAAEEISRYKFDNPNPEVCTRIANEGIRRINDILARFP